MKGLIIALDADDALGALQFVAPDEVEGVSALISAVQDRSVDTGVGALTPGGDLDIVVSTTQSKVVTLADNAARVEVEISGSSATSGALADVFGNEDEDATPTNTAAASGLQRQRTEVGVGAVQRGTEFEDTEISVIVVRLGDGWFVSPLLSAGEYAVDQFDLANGDYDKVGAARAKTVGGKTGVAAVESLLDGGADFDRSAVSDALASGEARFMEVFADAIDDLVEDGEVAMSEAGNSFDLNDVTLEAQPDGSVALASAEIDVSTYETSNTIKIDSDCATWRDFDANRVERCVLTNAPLVEPLDVDSLVFHVAKQSGAFRVKLLTSAAILAADVIAKAERTAVLDALDAELIDTPTQLTFGQRFEGSFDGASYRVFEVDVPAGIPEVDYTLDVVGENSASYLGTSSYVDTDGEWSELYWGVNPSSASAIPAGTVRIVVSAYCGDYDDEALLFRCRDDGDSFAIVVQPPKTAGAAFLGTTTLSLKAGQMARLTFSASSEIDATYTVSGPDGAAVYAVITGPDGYTSYGANSIFFVPGEYVASFVNETGEAAEFVVSFEQAQVPEPGPTDISATQSTTFDLGVGAYVEFGAHANDGDQVVITAVPNDGQDIVLTVSSSGGEICGSVSNGDWGGYGSAESCSFDVTSGGRFAVWVAAADDDNSGSVTVALASN